MRVIPSKKLLQHAEKVTEHVFERRITEKVKTDTMQFGFMSEKGTMMQSALFHYKQMQLNMGTKERSSIFAFVQGVPIESSLLQFLVGGYLTP